MFKEIKSQSGFSLIELMVVVAIIGILASIGIPQMSKFQARARQSEAKAHLATIYTAEQSFQSEWSFYSIDLKNIGAGATGTNLRYDGGFGTGAGCTGYPAVGLPAETNANGVMSANAPAGTTYYNNTLTVNGTMTSVGLGAVSGLAATGCAQTTFSARVWGQPNNAAVAAGTYDVWGIDENKLIANTRNGIL